MFVHDRRGFRHFRRPGHLLTDATHHRRQRLIGIALMCGTVAVFACLDASAKYLGARMDPLQVAWARYTSAFVLTLFISNPISHPNLIKTRRPLLQAIRGFLLVASTVLNFVALQWLQLDEALSIIFTFPFIVAIASGPILGEWLGWRRWTAIAVGFGGVLLITRPGLGAPNLGALFSLASVTCYGLYAVLTRVVSRVDSNQTSLFFNNAVGAAAMLPVIPFVWTTPANWQLVLLLVCTGVFGSFGHFLMIAAHKLAPAAVLSPFIYTQLIWVTILGYLVFDHVPNEWTLGGAAIVIGSGLYLLYRERRVGKDTTSAAVIE
jgi:drug/metabolite transporter (DMT)-like permease